jgi:A/G-specific adenine glycosylase
MKIARHREAMFMDEHLQARRSALVRAIGPLLVRWYRTVKRDLPWRNTRDPYRIWVSEMMLQQTRVEAAIPYYEMFMRAFPTIEALADASEDQVLKVWEGLGYYQRARYLHQAAREVRDRYGGRIPDDPAEISRLPGIGDYTAGAILSIAYQRDVPAVDGNALRVLARIFLIEDDIGGQPGRRRIRALAQAAIPPGQASFFNQSLMELGARVCLPKKPKCSVCPVASVCIAHAEGAQEEYPVKSRKASPREVDLAVGIIRAGDRLLIRKRPEEGLLAGLWEFPGSERQPGESWEEALKRMGRSELGIELKVGTPFGKMRHVFSHLVWNIQAYSCEPVADTGIVDGESVRWVETRDLGEFAFPAAFGKMVKSLQGLV